MKDIESLCINTIRVLSGECIERAHSGHPGICMGAAPMAFVLWTKFLKHNPQNPRWPNRDRFILSAGHGSMLLYSLLFLSGYDISLEDLKSFRQWGSITPGHPEYGLTPGVETTTGPLGQGFANGVGMAIAERFLAEHFNRPGFEIVDHHIYAIVSDGDLMEGISHEAGSLAGHLGLGKLIYLYDDNRITIDGSTDITYTEDRLKRFEAYGWHVQSVSDGNDLKTIEDAIKRAKDETEKPSLIVIRTHLGYGSPNKQDHPSAHGEPLGEQELKLTKERLGWPLDKEFYVPEQVLEYFRRAVSRGREWEEEWNHTFSEYRKRYPELSSKWDRWMRGKIDLSWERELLRFSPDSKGMATRVASGKTLNIIARHVPNLMGGSADLSGSNKTIIEGEGRFQRGNYGERNIHFGVREHAMAGILNGMALHGGVIPYGGTFLVFSDYMRPSMRLASMMKLKVIYIFTHDSIGIGEDGPTHQPIEQLTTLRAMPQLTVIRPCDANETRVAWKVALEVEGPVALILSRQALPIIDRTEFNSEEGLCRGAYILNKEEEGPDIILISSGSEVHPTIEAYRLLKTQDIRCRVVSMPSWELFDAQSEDYRREILPADIKKIVIEAAYPLGWERYAGCNSTIMGIKRYGASAPYKVLFEKFGFTPQDIRDEALRLLKSS